MKMMKYIQCISSRLWRLIVSFLLIIVAVCVAFVSCWIIDNTTQLVDIKKINIDLYDAVALTYSYNPYAWEHYGYLMFIKPNGMMDMVKIGRLEGNKLSWTSHSLFFADNKHDYHLYEHQKNYIETYDKASTTIDGLLTLADGKTRILAYNKGFTQHGYDQPIAVVSNKLIREINGRGEHMMPLSACGSEVYGFNSNTNQNGIDVTIVNQVLDSQQHVLSRKVLTANAPLGGIAHVNGALACNQSAIYSLTHHTLSEKQSQSAHQQAHKLLSYTIDEGQGVRGVPALDVYHVKSGKYTVLPLVLENGKSISSLSDFSHYAFMFSKFTQDSVQGKYLYWLLGSGQYCKTDITTGITSVLNDKLITAYPRAVDRHPSLFLSFSQGKAVILVENVTSNPPSYMMITLDKTTGNLLKTRELKTPDKQIPKGFSAVDFVAHP